MLTVKEYEIVSSSNGNFINVNKNFYYIFGNIRENMNVLEFDNYDEAISFKESNEHLGKPISICSGSELIALFKIAFGDNIFVNETVISVHYKIEEKVA